MTTATATATSPPEPEMVSKVPEKTVSRPALLTLSGLYHTSKAVYVSYVPERASTAVESIAERLLAASSPLVESIHSRLPENIKSSLPTVEVADQGAEKKEGEEEKDDPAAAAAAAKEHVAKLDAFLKSLCSEADAKVDVLLTQSSTELATRVAAVKQLLSERVAAVRPAVEARAESVKTAVHDTLGQERVEALHGTAVDAVSTVKEYAPAARHAACGMLTSARDHVHAHGVVKSARAGLAMLLATLSTALEVVRTEGLFAGARSLFASAKAWFVSTLDTAKAEVDAAGAAPAPAAGSSAAAASSSTTTTAGKPLEAGHHGGAGGSKKAAKKRTTPAPATE